ncbi:MAG: methyltransferase domain-containing protein [Anaerolineae bacterium]|nr:methyltransferase domain-containing protein [Anaerolineae bacterium]
MAEQSLFQVPPYSRLAAIYDRTGLSAYTRQQVPRYLALAHSLDWAGRRVLDLGCGTGVSTWLLARQGMRVFGLDASAEMLAQAAAQSQAFAEDSAAVADVYEMPTFRHMDIRHLEASAGLVDLALAAGGVLNAMPSLHDLEQVFVRVHGALEDGKLFIFDMYTLQGLAASAAQSDRVIFDNGSNLLLIARTHFSYETQRRTVHYTIFAQQSNLTWGRADEVHVERGYPVQGIVALLERAGFAVLAVLRADLEPLDAQEDSERAVFVAARQPHP